MSKKEIDAGLYVRISELAVMANVHQYFIEKLIYQGVLSADAKIRHGKTVQPVFLASRIDQLVRKIRDHKNN